MSMYGDYIKERENKFIVETNKGYFTYKFIKNNKECYLVDVYVIPEYRRQGIAKEFVNKAEIIAKEHNCNNLYTSASKSANSYEASVEIIKKCGFKKHSDAGELVWFKKEL